MITDSLPIFTSRYRPSTVPPSRACDWRPRRTVGEDRDPMPSAWSIRPMNFTVMGGGGGGGGRPASGGRSHRRRRLRPPAAAAAVAAADGTGTDCSPPRFGRPAAREHFEANVEASRIDHPALLPRAVVAGDASFARTSRLQVLDAGRVGAAESEQLHRRRSPRRARPRNASISGRGRVDDDGADSVAMLRSPVVGRDRASRSARDPSGWPSPIRSRKPGIPARSRARG